MIYKACIVATGDLGIPHIMSVLIREQKCHEIQLHSHTYVALSV